MAAAVTPRAASSFWPTISRWLPPCRRKRAEVGLFDGHRVADPGLGRTQRCGPVRQVELLAEQGIARQVGGGVTLEDDRRPRQGAPALVAHGADLLQVVFSPLVGEPDDLEEMVSLGRSVGVVVDGLARSGQPLGGQVVLGQDQE